MNEARIERNRVEASETVLPLPDLFAYRGFHLPDHSSIFENLKRAREKNGFTKSVIAWIDESGEKGFISRLRPEHDDAIGIMCAICAPIEREQEIRESFRPSFDLFQEHFGTLPKVHITDAYGTDGDKRPVLEQIRHDVFRAVAELELPVMYEAARLGVVRESFERQQRIEQGIRDAHSEQYAFGNHADNRRIEVRLATGLARKLDAFSYWAGADHLDLYFDSMNGPLFHEIQEEIGRLGRSENTVVAKGWDKKLRKPVRQAWTIKRKTDVPTSFLTLRSMEMVNPVDERIFAVDVVASSLRRHLSRLAPTALLNIKGATVGWPLSANVVAPPTPSIEDFL
jgi:hypothetical protein